MDSMLLQPFIIVSNGGGIFTAIPNKLAQPLNKRLQLLADHLTIADLLYHQCRAVRVPRSAKDRHTTFIASLKRLRTPLHDLVAQVRHGTADSQCPEVYAKRVRQAVLTFKRKLIALQRVMPRLPDLNQLLHSTHTIARRMRHFSYNLERWIADHAKWWNFIKSE